MVTGPKMSKTEKDRERRRVDPEFRAREKKAREKYRATHPEKVKEVQHLSDKKRKDKRSAYYQANKEKFSERGKKYREENIEYERNRGKEKAKRYLAQGFCHNCPTPRMPNSDTCCEKHWFSRKATQRLGLGGETVERGRELKDRLEAQKRTCPYTGVSLVPGINASVDHIIPVSQRPDLKGDFSNIE